MQALQPIPPRELNALAADVLDKLRGQPAAEHIILGGGVALQHYCPYRTTVDLDAWWRDRARKDTEGLLEQVLTAVGQERGLTYQRRSFGDTQSFELLRESKKVFTVQIAVRSLALDDPLPSAWAPVAIETFQDNLGSKMNALIGRGAPRDFTDVFEVCRRGMARPEDCWSLWQQKNPGQSLGEAKSRVLLHLEQIAARRPLETLSDPAERQRAEELRAWVQRQLCLSRP
jgi:Nucleotidyl transferase AbiEii toxin, Type IV TA system